jgi:hypothetical protein
MFQLNAFSSGMVFADMRPTRPVITEKRIVLWSRAAEQTYKAEPS